MQTTWLTGYSTARITCCRSTSPKRCCSTTRRCSRRQDSPARRQLRLAARSGGKNRHRRPERFPDAELRLAVLAAVQNERHRVADPGPQADCLRHAANAGCDHAAGQSNRDTGDRQDLLDRPLGGTARFVLIRQGRHAARAFAGLFVHQGPGSLGQPRHAGRRTNAGQLGGSQQPRPWDLRPVQTA